MSSTYSVNKTICLGVVLCCMLLLFVDLALIRQVREDKIALQAKTEQSSPTKGMQMPSLVGYDVAGSKVVVSYGTDKKRTLILVTSPTCHACNDNWANWDRLLRSIDNNTERVIIVDIDKSSPPLSSDYIRTHGLNKLPVLVEVADESLLAYHFQYTPQTLLLNSNGVVEQVITGAADPRTFL